MELCARETIFKEGRANGEWKQMLTKDKNHLKKAMLEAVANDDADDIKVEGTGRLEDFNVQYQGPPLVRIFGYILNGIDFDLWRFSSR